MMDMPLNPHQSLPSIVDDPSMQFAHSNSSLQSHQLSTTLNGEGVNSNSNDDDANNNITNNKRDHPLDSSAMEGVDDESRSNKKQCTNNSSSKNTNDGTTSEGSNNTSNANNPVSILALELDLETSNDPIIPPSKEGTSDFNDADVLSGRGGGTNVHPGNRDFRDLINKYRTSYLKARKNDKPAISRAIVKLVRNNGGRFLKKDERDNLYYEIGDAQAREKTSQALRQKAPEMRKLLLEQQTHLVGAGNMGGVLVAGPAMGDIAPMPPQGVAGGMSDEQFRMSMPLFAANGMNPQFAAGLQAGMGVAFNAPMMAAAGNGGHMMGVGPYNPAFFQAMMVGMGGGGVPGGPGMGFETTPGTFGGVFESAPVGAPGGHSDVQQVQGHSGIAGMQTGGNEANNEIGI
jgi:hypothetical protein